MIIDKFRKLFSVDKLVVLLTVPIVAVPLLISGYLVSNNISQSMEAEKISKLYGIGNTLDTMFDSDYSTLLKEANMDNATKEEKIAYLSSVLTPISDAVVSGFRNTGIGYYSRDLDAIITYSPSDKMGYTVGLPITRNHHGRIAMREGKWQSYRGSELVWGNGIAVFFPMKRNGQVIGYIWAVELIDEIETQLLDTKLSILIAMVIGLGLAILGVMVIAHRNVRVVNDILDGITMLKANNDFRFPKSSGTFGEISNAINKMSDDLARQKDLENRMLKTEQMLVLGFMTLSIAHEIKNPLMAISGFAQLTKEFYIESGTSNDKILRYISIIEKESMRMDKLINTLLRHSRGKDTGVGESYLDDLISECVGLMESNIRQAKVHLTHANNMNQRQKIVCEIDKFKQIILNLMLNAISAVDERERKEISVILREDAKNSYVSIRDNGTGIKEENFKNIFSPFFSTKETGTGLGLFVAKGIIDSMRWNISVSSEYGNWTEFMISIPKNFDDDDSL